MAKLTAPSVQLITETNSDLTIVNSARVSFAKQSCWDPDVTLADVLKPSDAKLIEYLAAHNHWTTFAHCNEVYRIRSLSKAQLKDTLLKLQNPSGLTFVRTKTGDLYLKGSLVALAREIHVLPQSCAIRYDLVHRYPVGARALGLTLEGLGSSYRGNPKLKHMTQQELLEPSVIESLPCWRRSEESEVLSWSKNPEQRLALTSLASLLSVTLRLSAPVFIARQLVKHTWGFVWNEVSRRYVKDAPGFFDPVVFRAAPKADPVTGKVSNKQGSSSESVLLLDHSIGMTPEEAAEKDLDYFTLATEDYDIHCGEALKLYSLMLQNNVAPEDARMVLPQSMMTQWYWTGSLLDYLRVYRLRTEEHTQAKTREVAQMVDEVLTEAYPETWVKLKAQGN